MISLKAVLRMRMMSALSLLTIVSCLVSQRMGTVYLSFHISFSEEEEEEGREEDRPPRIILLRLEIQFLYMFKAIERFFVRGGEWIGSCEWPAVGAHFGGYDSYACFLYELARAGSECEVQTSCL